MTGTVVDIFAAQSPAPTRRLALVAEPARSSELTRSVLAACGVVPVLLGASSEEEITARGRRADLVVIDADFGGPRQGLRLLEATRRRTDASIILLGEHIDPASATATADRCQILHRPVHESQFRATVQLALMQRRLRTEGQSHPHERHQKLEQAIRQIGGVLSALAARPVSPTGSGVRLEDLRPRERQIVDMLLIHYRVPAIASTLGISTHTVRNHLKNIYRRLGVHSQQDLLCALTTPGTSGADPLLQDGHRAQNA